MSFNNFFTILHFWQNQTMIIIARVLLQHKSHTYHFSRHFLLTWLCHVFLPCHVPDYVTPFHRRRYNGLFTFFNGCNTIISNNRMKGFFWRESLNVSYTCVLLLKFPSNRITFQIWISRTIWETNGNVRCPLKMTFSDF